MEKRRHVSQRNRWNNLVRPYRKSILGPQKGSKLKRIPNVQTTWNHWLLLHPESTAYDLFDGNRYPTPPLPDTTNAKLQSHTLNLDPRLDPNTKIIGVEFKGERESLSPSHRNRASLYSRSSWRGGDCHFWHSPTQSAIAFRTQIDNRQLTFRADAIAPETAPFMDHETQTRWTIAGRAVDGPLRGEELLWIPSISCHWHAWASEYPNTSLICQFQIF